MKLSPRSYGWKFFYVSALVVVLAGCLTVAIFLLFALANAFRPAATITAAEMDTDLHNLTPAVGDLWETRAAWPARFDRFRREEKLAPVRIVVLDTAGRVLYREGTDTPLDVLAGPGAVRNLARLAVFPFSFFYLLLYAAWVHARRLARRRRAASTSR